ncbi:PRP24 [[Candida] subhashii]|uniref:PRP24 n=1 Tax=[Candida] subhashii TaxID=561895 RepID=A0A8J5QQK9_9ASCO|nr:PRP24 [[Candida] subhashii]KAG7664886.1 PRP24 [[Candida] subhashii]
MVSVRTLETRLKDLQKKIAKEPYKFATHENACKLVKLLPQNHSLRDKIYFLKGQYFVPTKSDADDFIKYVNTVGKLSDDGRKVFDQITNQYPTVKYWKEYLKAMRNSPYYSAYLERAWDACRYDYCCGNEIFDIMVEYKDKYYEEWPDILDLFDQRLRIPHVQIDETLNEFKYFVTKYKQSEYWPWADSRSRVHDETKEDQRLNERFEKAIKKNPSDVFVWLDYMEGIYERDKHMDGVYSIFTRAIVQDFPDEWALPLWKSLIRMARIANVTEEFKLDHLSSYVRTFPYYPAAYVEYLAEAEESDFDMIYSRVQSNGVLSKGKDPNLTVAEAIVVFRYGLTRSVFSEWFEETPALFKTIEEYVTESFTRPNDGKYRIPKLAIKIYDEFDEEDKAGEIIDRLTSTYSSRGDVWLWAIDYMKNKLPSEGIRTMYEEAIDSLEGCDPDNKLEELRYQWLQFEEFSELKAKNLKAKKHALWKCYQSEKKEERNLGLH